MSFAMSCFYWKEPIFFYLLLSVIYLYLYLLHAKKYSETIWNANCLNPKLINFSYPKNSTALRTFQKFAIFAIKVLNKSYFVSA